MIQALQSRDVCGSGNPVLGFYHALPNMIFSTLDIVSLWRGCPVVMRVPRPDVIRVW